MALKKCPACGNEVSTGAVTCPKCGHVLKKKTSCLGVVIGVVIIAIIGGIAATKIT